MSTYTNAVTNITDESKYYVYPMAASLRGGAVESEYNIRNLMTCLFNKSAAKYDEDFIVFYNRAIEGKRPTLETYYDNANWYEINLEDKYCLIKDLAVGPGEGNCNGYYTRLYDYTPISNTFLDISRLLMDDANYTPVLPSDLAPMQPVAKTSYDSLDILLAAELSGTISETTESGEPVDYIVDNKYIDGTSVRIANADGSFIYYVKHNGAWVINSDIVTVYSSGGVTGDTTAEYHIYKNRKYFYRNTSNNNNIDIIDFSDNNLEHRTDDDDNTYIVLPGNTELYKIASKYQKYNIVLGLNWTTNQLVSSAQITVCEDSTKIKTITETDLDGDKTEYSFTEYGLLNKTMQDNGLLDAGILLGTISIKKTPVYNEVNGNANYTYEYSCTYEGNRYKTACIDLAKLGTDTDNLGENMYDKISRLFSLMIDSGSFKIGTVIKNSGFDKNPESAKHDFLAGIAPYRLDMGISDFESGIGQQYINGYLRFINYNEEFNGATEVLDGYIFKCRLKVNSDTGEAVEIESLTLCNDGIECFNDRVNFNCNVNIGSNAARANLHVYGNTTLDRTVYINDDSYIAANKKIIFSPGSGNSLSADTDGIHTANFNVSSNLNTHNLYVDGHPTGGDVYGDHTLEVTPGIFRVNTRLIDINSSEGLVKTAGNIEIVDNTDLTTPSITLTRNSGKIFTKGNIEAKGSISTDSTLTTKGTVTIKNSSGTTKCTITNTNGNINSEGSITAAGNVTATKVYGAVWM